MSTSFPVVVKGTPIEVPYCSWKWVLSVPYPFH